MLFGELSDRCSQATEDAKAGYEAEGGPDSTPSDETQRWQETHQQLHMIVVDELRAAAERNASLGAHRPSALDPYPHPHPHPYLSPCHSVALPRCRPATLSPCHAVALPRCRHATLCP